MRIIEDDLTGVEISALLETHFAAMLASSPAESCHFLDFDGLNAPDVTFWSIWDGHAHPCRSFAQRRWRRDAEAHHLASAATRVCAVKP
jgi:hypothetical protein